MPVEVIMPKVDMDMTKGKVSTWHVAEGEAVTRGAPLFDIETDKAAMEVESPATGRLQHVSARAGDEVPVGGTLAWLYAEGEEVGPPPAAAPSAPAEEATTPAAQPHAAPSAPSRRPTPPQPSEPAAANARPRATPAARALARSAGLELAAIDGTGPRGRVQRDDVALELERAEADLAAPAPAGSRFADGEADGLLHVTRRRGEGRPIVLIHGFASDNASWSPFERHLPPDAPLIRIELPGHGSSPHKPARSFAELSRIVLETFDEATQDAGEVHLVGHSLGGGVALALADVRPRRVASLGLICPAGLGPEIDGACVAGIARASRADSLLPWLRRLSGQPDTIGEDYARAAMVARRDPALRAYQSALADAVFPDGVQAFDLRAALERVSSPCTVVWGKRDALLPWRQALSAPGGAALHLLPDVGHIPHIERPKEVARIFERLFASVAANV